MILWANTPAASQAQLYLPALNATDILDLADARYPSHDIAVVDPHTVAFGTGGVTFVPLPQGAALAAGLLAVDLSPSIHKGDLYKIVVRQVTDAVPQPVIQINARVPQAVAAARGPRGGGALPARSSSPSRSARNSNSSCPKRACSP